MKENRRELAHGLWVMNEYRENDKSLLEAVMGEMRERRKESKLDGSSAFWKSQRVEQSNTES